ncbi:glycosyl hydrolase family 18 protein [Parapedobacter sp. 10938]|uniref:glycosyl hydrolase family 18 protein n=1 Tax=Parapedobacter flavus TaxID=3110225 RepID=UPI002DB84D4D|nr:glycosyl hydrolase family 18 protein [Parapedobacter sp. 10938]MEC3879300.1 glycosyl hydrolase family 18 protein [Parapedobacter sp. 10938]
MNRRAMNKRMNFWMPVLLLLVAASGCEKNGDTTYSTDFHPRIFDRTGVFTSPSMIISQGETANFTGLLFSPAAAVDISWKVDGTEVSTDTAFAFTPDGGGEYTITLEVSNGDQTTSRTSSILVNPTDYTLKPYTSVAMSYLSDGGTAADVDWGTVTHVAFQCARVLPDGGLDVTAGQTNQAADEVVARAHINGIPVLLGIAGRLTGLDGWALYESNDFGGAIANPATRELVVQNVVNYVTDRRMDGVDIMMTDINSGAYSSNLAAIGPFLADLRAALPADALITVTVGTGWQHWEYPDLSAADWLNVRGFENGLTVGPGAPLGQPSPFQFMVDGATIWLNHGISKEKIVLGIPAFGLQYNEIDDNGNNLSWGSYSYVPYRDILAADSEAHNKEMIEQAHGVYFNGIPLVTQKAEYVKDNGFKGVYLWAGDYDVAGEKSLMGTIYGILQ